MAVDVALLATGPEESSVLFGHDVLSSSLEYRTGRFTSIEHWVFHPSGVPPPLALDDGTFAQPEPALVPETEQRAYVTLSGMVVTGLGAPSMLPEGFTDGGLIRP